jgi:penicillin-binding protein 1A
MNSRLERTQKQKRRKKIIKSSIFIFILIIIVPLFVLPGCSKLTEIISGTPELDLTAIEQQNEASFFYDIHGNVITEYFSYENRTWAPIDEIPLQMRNAFISVEDKRFYSHIGVDPIRIAGSFINNLKGGVTQGGSTLTQQLIKLIYLTQEQTYARKIQEALLSLRLERVYTKDQILESYLNTIYLAQSNYGVKAAALDYFGISNLSNLSLRQSAMLACVANRPNYYDPRKAQYENPEAWEDLNARTDLILSLMLEGEFISESDYQSALSETLNVKKDAIRLSLYAHASYIDYAIDEVVDYLVAVNGWDGQEDAEKKAELLLYTGGFHITTAMDEVVQSSAEETLYNWTDYPPLLSNPDDVAQACTAIVNNSTGYLTGIVGSRTPPSAERELNRAESPLMPGSSLKPIAVYGPALDLGASPATIYDNIPVEITGWDPKQSYPQNYGNRNYTGPTTMRNGLIDSVNIVAARCLVQNVGLSNAINYLINMNFNTKDLQETGSGIALGTSSVTAISMASAYATIANAGIYHKPISVLKIIDRDGNVLVDNTLYNPGEPIYKETTAWLLLDMMEDAVNYGTGIQAQIEGMTVAGKTGTSTDYKGVYFCGITPYYSAAVWVGDDTGESLGSSAQGGRNAAPLFSDFMTKIHSKKALTDKPILDTTPEQLGLKQYSICSVSGLLAGPNCPQDRIIIDWFVPGTQPTETCKNHVSANICSASGKYPTIYCPEETVGIKQFYLLPEDSVYRWLSPDEITKYLPEAADAETEDMLLHMHDDPPRAQDYCHVHTEPLIEEPVPDSTLPTDIETEQNGSSFFDNLDTLIDQLLPGSGTPTPTPIPIISVTPQPSASATPADN